MIDYVLKLMELSTELYQLLILPLVVDSSAVSQWDVTEDKLVIKLLITGLQIEPTNNS